jgi:hypothetical protein
MLTLGISIATSLIALACTFFSALIKSAYTMNKSKDLDGIPRFRAANPASVQSAEISAPT